MRQNLIGRLLLYFAARLALLSLLFMGVALTAMPDQNAVKVAMRAPKVSLDQCWCLLTAGASHNPDGRWSQPEATSGEVLTPSTKGKMGGVVWLLTEHATRMYDQGYRNFYIDCPFGKDTDSKGVPQFTFFGALRGESDSEWRLGFVKEWKRVTSLPHIHVMMYMGHPMADAEFREVVAKGDTATAMRMLREAVQPLKDADVDAIGIDASFDTGEESLTGEWIKMLQMMGFDVYIEGTPSKSKPWLKELNTIRSVWLAINLPKFADKGASLTAVKDIKGKKILVHDGNLPDPAWKGMKYQDWLPIWIKRTILSGEQPAFAPWDLDTGQLKKALLN